MGTPSPQSPVLRSRLADAVMRYEAMSASLLETAQRYRPVAQTQPLLDGATPGAAETARVVRLRGELASGYLLAHAAIERGGGGGGGVVLR